MPWSRHVFILERDSEFASRLEKKNFHCASKQINDEASEIS